MLTFIAGALAAPAIWLTAFSVVSLLLFIFAVLEKGFFTFILTAATAYLVAVRYPDLVTNPTFLIAAAAIYVIGGLLVGRFKWSRFLSIQFEKLSNIRDGFLLSNGLPLDAFKKGISNAANLYIAAQKAKDTNDRKRKAFAAAPTVEQQTPEELATEQQDAERELLQKYSNYVSERVNIYNTPSEKSLQSIHTAAAPKAKDNKGSIVMWIGYWPVYLVWYLIADICKDIGTAIYNAVGGHFQKMSDEKFSQM